MWVVVAGIGGIAAILGVFRFLQWLSDRTYKPTPQDVARILEANLEGRLDLAAFDEFSCVRIAYDPRLDRIRERFNEIVEDPNYITGEATSQNAAPLSEAGKAKLRELIDELNEFSARTGG